MKALTLTQPWASLVAAGAKKIETRSWKTNYRGPLAIHAAKGFPIAARLFAELPSVVAAFPPDINPKGMIWRSLPTSSVVAVCNLVACWPVEYFSCNGLVSREEFIGDKARVVTARMDSRERAFGDYGGGRYAWILEDVHPFEAPMFAKGALVLWEWEWNLPPANSRRTIAPAIDGVCDGLVGAGPSASSTDPERDSRLDETGKAGFLK